MSHMYSTCQRIACLKPNDNPIKTALYCVACLDFFKKQAERVNKDAQFHAIRKVSQSCPKE